MSSYVDGTLLRLSIVRTIRKNIDNDERPIRQVKREDLPLLKKLITEIRLQYSESKKQMHLAQEDGSPDFERIKKKVISTHFGRDMPGVETLNFLSSCISCYISLSVQKKIDIDLEELRQYSLLFLQKSRPARLHQ